MAEEIDKIIIETNVNIKDALQKLQMLEDKASGVSTKSKSSIGVMGVAMGAAFGGAVLMGAQKLFNTITDGFSSALNEAMAQENAMNQLNNALKLSGNFSKEASNAMSDFANEMQKTTLFADDVVLKNAAVLESLTNLDVNGLKRATKAAMDFSTATGKDLETSMQMIAKAANGQTDSFSRMGIKINETGTKADVFNRTMQIMEGRFGGAAAGAVNTFGGALKQAENKFSDMLEKFGELITKSPEAVRVIKLVGLAFDSIASYVEKLAASDFFGKLINGALEYYKVLVEYVYAPLEVMFNLLKNLTIGIAGVFEALYKFIDNIFGGVITEAFIYFGRLVYDYLIMPFVNWRDTMYAVFYYIVEGIAIVADAIVHGLGTPIGKIIGFFNKDLGDTITNFTATTLTKIEELKLGLQASAINTVFETPFTNGIKKSLEFSQAFINTKDKVTETANVMKENVNTAIAGITWSDISTQMKMAENKIVMSAASIAKAVNTYIVQGFSNAFAAMGGALVNGENAFEAFGKSVLGALGDILMYVGQMMIAVGLCLSTVPMIFGMQGAAAVAAGAAAMVLGGALKALAGSGGGSKAPQGGAVQAPSETVNVANIDNNNSQGGGIASTPATAVETVSEVAQVEEKKPQVNIALNVQGNILNNKESALYITEVLNDNFASSGLVLQG